MARNCRCTFINDEWLNLGGTVNKGANTIAIVTEKLSPFVISVVPEPGALPLIGLAALLAGHRRM
jgi:hypothetical protein